MLLPSASVLMEKLESACKQHGSAGAFLWASGASGAGWHWEALGGSWRHKEGSGGGSRVGSSREPGLLR